MQRVPCSAPEESGGPPDGRASRFLRWSGPETLVPAARRIAVEGHVVILAGAAAVGLPPPLPQESAAAARSAHAKGFLVRRGIARLLVARILGGAAQDYAIAPDAAGAPQIPGGLHVSFSARGETGVIALGRAPLGVDYEPALPPAGIPWNLLRADERAVLAGMAPAQQAEAFLALWRAKEATLKALGLGFACSPESVRVEGELAHVDAYPRHFCLISSPEAGVTLAIAAS